jgi:flagellar hook assembly protein FlgD
VNVLYYVGKAASTVTVEVYDEKKNLVRKLTASGSAGFQTFTWDVKVTQPVAAPAKGKGKSKDPASTEPTLKYASKGKYTVKFVNGGESSEVLVEIR